MICLTKGELDKLFRDAMSPILCEEITKSGLTMDELRSNRGEMLQIVSAMTARNVVSIHNLEWNDNLLGFYRMYKITYDRILKDFNGPLGLVNRYET